MQISDIWKWYCVEQLGNPARLPALEPLSPDDALRLLWEFHPLFTPRMDAIRATRYSEAFDEEADAALATLARDDTPTSWEGLSAGAWRVLQARLSYCETIIQAAALQGAREITSLPAGLPKSARAPALLLRFLLGECRTIPPSLLDPPDAGSPPAFPSAPLRRR